MEIEQILEECLDDVRNHRASVEECLAKYPEHAAKLKPLLNIWLAIDATPDVLPSEAFVMKTRERILRSSQPKAPVGLGHFLSRFTLASAAFASLVLIVAFVGGIIFAASESLPGSPLYPVKREVEAFQIILARDDEAQVRLRLLLASQRLKEAAALSNAGKADLTEQVIKEYGVEVNAAVSKIQTQPQPKPMLANEVTTQLTRQQNVIHGIQTKVPAPAVQRALSANAQALDQVSVLSGAPAATRTSTPTVIAPTSTRTSVPPTATATLTASLTATLRPTMTSTSTVVPTITSTSTVTPTLTATPTSTATISATATLTATLATLTATVQPTTITPSPTATASITATRTVTTTTTPSVTPTR